MISVCLRIWICMKFCFKLGPDNILEKDPDFDYNFTKSQKVTKFFRKLCLFKIFHIFFLKVDIRNSMAIGILYSLHFEFESDSLLSSRSVGKIACYRTFKGAVSRKLSPMLLYIVRKLSL